VLDLGLGRKLQGEFEKTHCGLAQTRLPCRLIIQAWNNSPSVKILRVLSRITIVQTLIKDQGGNDIVEGRRR